MEPRLATGLWVFAGTSDRFNPGGYKPSTTVREQIELAAKIPGIKAVELHQSDFVGLTPKEFVRLLADKGLICSVMDTNVWGESKYMHGAFTNRDPKIRRQALDEARKSVDLARQVKSPSIALWLGAEGFDYPFQSDYAVHWDLLLEGIRETAEYAAPDIKVGIEYKLREPRNRMTIGDVGKAFWIVTELAMENIGVTVDFGHALMAKESPAESVALLASRKKLFNVHLNDALRDWDDDLVVGTIHLWETLEFLYWCQRTKYTGWLGLDMFPYREDSLQAADMAIRNLKALWKMAEKIDVPALRKAQRSMDAIASQEVVRKVVFG